MSKELEYIQRQINIVKQQVKGSKIRIIVTDTVTKHQYDYYERELQTLESIEQALNRLEAIDNAEPSEALETLKDMIIGNGVNDNINDYVDNLILPIKQALERLESIDNAEPSKVLECLKSLDIQVRVIGILDIPSWEKYLPIIKQALIKAQENARSEEILQKYYQEGITLDSVRALKKEMAELKRQVPEPKKYLKWEDLEFKEEGQIIKVILNGSKYKVAYFTDGITEYVDLLTDGEKLEIIGRYVDADSHEKQFFNDLHLERVEE